MNILQHRLLNFTCTTTTNWKYCNETSLKDIYTIILIIKGERFWGACPISAFTKTKEKHEPVKRICYRSVSKLTRCCEPIGLIYKLRSNYDFYQCTYIILRVCRSTDRIIFLQVAHKSPFSVRYWGLGVIPLMLDYFCFPRVTVSVCDIRVMAYRYFDFCQLLLVPITILFRHLIQHRQWAFFFILAFKCIYYSISRPEEISTIYRRLLPSDPLVLLHKQCGILWLWIYKPLIHPGS